VRRVHAQHVHLVSHHPQARALAWRALMMALQRMTAAPQQTIRPLMMRPPMMQTAVLRGSINL
jgi:hypothetical protein